jgi:diguanylate cyclase (GGDEF)-like protein
MAGAAALALLLGATTDGTDPQRLAIAAALSAAVTVGIVWSPWHRLPAIARAAPPLSYLVAIAMLRDAVGPAEAGPGILVLLPVVYSALYLSRLVVTLVSLAAACVFLFPVLAGADGYPAADWRTGVVYSAVALAVGLTVHDLVARVRRLAASDPLTGLANRRAWDAALRDALREGRALCVAIIDLDRFKEINDRGGHAHGDAVLRASAAAWHAVLRPGDLIARLGGDEFGVLLLDCCPADAEPVVARLRAATPLGATCSIGWDAAAPGDDGVGLLRRADRALYAAKDAGRDRALQAA